MMLVSGSAYFAVNELAYRRGVTVFDPAQVFVVEGRTLDSRIPYLPWTILVYHGLFELLLCLPFLTYPKTSSGARDLFRLYEGQFVLTLIACAVFLIAPAEMALRVPAEQHGDSVVDQLNLLVHVQDRPFNTWPSLHVAWTCLATLQVTRWIRSRRRKILLWACFVVVAISTLTVKQHYLWDVISAALLALGYWRWKLRKPTSGSSEPAQA
ncbi:MAG: membrane-associated phospholipid phosphatase [Planctomycetota bacterium]|jgi:membrane-associated phospholipid phosphatase